MLRLLLTNIHLRDFGGSEMVTFELAEEFALRGWSVDVYTNVLGEPMAKEIAALSGLGVRVSNDPEEFGDHDYDLLWIHHSILPESAIRRILGSRHSPRIIWNHMSPFGDLEMPLLADIESRVASLVTFVSPETKTALLKFGLPSHRSRLLQNPAPRSFVSAKVAPRPGPFRQVLFVSNHPPQEIQEASLRLKQLGINAVHVGGPQAARMTLEIMMRDIDAVVTIGKTAQYALCLGLPVFEYDHFGGCGWITGHNLEGELQTNFSGRTTRRVLDGEAIASELISGFKDAKEFAQTKLSDHRLRFGLEPQIDAILKEVFSTQPKELNSSDALRWQSFTKNLRSMYGNSPGASSLLLRAELAEANSELLSCRLEDCDSSLNDLQEQILLARQRAQSLETSRALALGRTILRPVYWLRRTLSRRG